ncbi:uncharacterized protein G2W53_002336 [Senna tora]|uniref:Uncharacterized protein n=1 Tax=Senna tora TaxID=362788 RepID=A0A835CL40_9FABA|nr:uncharacterized protein G2W53_002336 [Senna tora]
MGLEAHKILSGIEEEMKERG